MSVNTFDITLSFEKVRVPLLEYNHNKNNNNNVTCDGGLKDIDGSLPLEGYRQDEDHADQTGYIPGWLTFSSSLLYGSESSEYGVEQNRLRLLGEHRSR